MKDVTMEEKRRSRRFQVSYFVRIFADGIDDVMGHIVDVSTTGMRILSDRSLVPDSDYVLFVDLEKVEGFGKDIAFNARCVWFSEDEDSGAYHNGMHLQDISEKEQVIIDRLIESLSKEG